MAANNSHMSLMKFTESRLAQTPSKVPNFDLFYNPSIDCHTIRFRNGLEIQVNFSYIEDAVNNICAIYSAQDEYESVKQRIQQSIDNHGWSTFTRYGYTAYDSTSAVKLSNSEQAGIDRNRNAFGNRLFQQIVTNDIMSYRREEVERLKRIADDKEQKRQQIAKLLIAEKRREALDRRANAKHNVKEAVAVTIRNGFGMTAAKGGLISLLPVKTVR